MRGVRVDERAIAGHIAKVIFGWIFIIPPLLLGMRRADSKWLNESLHPEAARRLRRVRAQAIRSRAGTKSSSDAGIIHSEE